MIVYHKFSVTDNLPRLNLSHPTISPIAIMSSSERPDEHTIVIFPTQVCFTFVWEKI